MPTAATTTPFSTSSAWRPTSTTIHHGPTIFRPTSTARFPEQPTPHQKTQWPRSLGVLSPTHSSLLTTHSSMSTSSMSTTRRYETAKGEEKTKGDLLPVTHGFTSICPALSVQSVTSSTQRVLTTTVGSESRTTVSTTLNPLSTTQVAKRSEAAASTKRQG